MDLADGSRVTLARTQLAALKAGALGDPHGIDNSRLRRD